MEISGQNYTTDDLDMLERIVEEGGIRIPKDNGDHALCQRLLKKGAIRTEVHLWGLRNKYVADGAGADSVIKAYREYKEKQNVNVGGEK